MTLLWEVVHLLLLLSSLSKLLSHDVGCVEEVSVDPQLKWPLSNVAPSVLSFSSLVDNDSEDEMVPVLLSTDWLPFLLVMTNLRSIFSFHAGLCAWDVICLGAEIGVAWCLVIFLPVLRFRAWNPPRLLPTGPAQIVLSVCSSMSLLLSSQVSLETLSEPTLCTWH